MSIASDLRQTLESEVERYDEIQALERFTERVDSVLCRLFDDIFGAQALALVAVGGYGRGLLHPYSDIDLLLLVEDAAEHTEAIETWVAALWDLGFDIGHAVRDVAQCHEAAADLSVVTALAERRFLRGDAALYTALGDSLKANPPWQAEPYVKAKIHELQARHSNNDEGSKRVEPNVKTAPGALRDIHTLHWLGLAVHGSADFSKWRDLGFLSEQEQHSLDRAEQYFNQLRTRLHLLAARKEDRLSFGAQQTLAATAGYDGDTNSAVEQFMRDGYYYYSAQVERLAHLIMQQFREYFDEQVEASISLGPRFVLLGESLHMASENVFADHPPALLEVYLMAADPRVKHMSTKIVRAIGAHLYLINDAFRQDPRCRALFLELLRQSAGVSHQLQRMHRHGVLRRYWPEFAEISGLMQFDMFHIYCVDEHSLRVLRYLQRMRFSRYSADYPVAGPLAKRADSTLLYMMALCHDVAKGRDGDHCVNGAPIAYQFCKDHGLSEADSQLVSWVVLHHLELSITAQKRDISDPELIQDFAKLMGDERHLNYLLLLTIADIQGTQPALWNSWRESLIHDLYRRTRNFLNNDSDGQQVVQRRRQRIEERLSKKYSKAMVTRLIDSIGEYGLRAHSSAETAWQLEQIAVHHFEPFVELVNFDDQGSTTLVLHYPDQPFMLTRVFAELSRRALSVLSASIQTTNDGYALDRLRIVDHRGLPIESRAQRQAIGQWVEAALSRSYEAPSTQGYTPSTALQVQTEVDFDQDISGYTRIDVVAMAQTGLLAAITAGLARCGLNVHRANIASFGERAEDSFVVSVSDTLQPVPESQYDAITAAIKQAIGELNHE